ncbi:MAG: class I SAM-dependent methyltransferase [Novosphingobium sp.]|nr:class I SAM-dependent methyltransferase [Novosphingobium sp.]MCP5403586.1 class I SAM-dependent methyltransferase [Novosphingobium sp.]
MPDLVTQAKWDRLAPRFDTMASKGAEERWQPFKQGLFENMDGKILFLALGTGLDIPFFPTGKDITAIDISPKMVEQAQERLAAYDGKIEAHVMDVHELTFEPESFDQVFTSCTFCSVPNPIEGLKALHRVLKPGGKLFMFEHTGSRFYPFKPMMNLMTALTRKLGPDMNRTTVANVKAAGFKVTEVNNVFLDVVKTIKAVKPG